MITPCCKYCKKPIEEDVSGFCEAPGDPCWKAWYAEVVIETAAETERDVTCHEPDEISELPPEVLPGTDLPW